MFASLQEDSAKRAPQFELNGFVTMATYWVADLLKIKGITGHLRPVMPRVLILHQARSKTTHRGAALKYGLLLRAEDLEHWRLG